jgi:hypothetical protein
MEGWRWMKKRGLGPENRPTRFPSCLRGCRVGLNPKVGLKGNERPRRSVMPACTWRSVMPACTWRYVIPAGILWFVIPACTWRFVTPACTWRFVMPACTWRAVMPACTWRAVMPACTWRAVMPACTWRASPRSAVYFNFTRDVFLVSLSLIFGAAALAGFSGLPRFCTSAAAHWIPIGASSKTTSRINRPTNRVHE